MNWEIATAKNGEVTLSLNGVQLYSRYRPREDAWRWIDSEFDASKTSYLLIGLGLGYHAERLIQLADGKDVYVYYFEQSELEMCPLSQAVNDIQKLDLSDCQILIPNVWLKALGEHPILPFLEDIKINQVTFKKYASIMENNFNENILSWSKHIEYPVYSKKIACLVASGPSLNETVHWLKDIQEKVEIFAVGSSLKILLSNNIVPSAVIISDAKNSIVRQIENTNYHGTLYFLSTANEQVIKKHLGDSYILFQQGYPLAEEAAQKYNMPLFETGGSVSTVAISLLDYIGFEKIILFGQDLGFVGNETHASNSTSGRKFQKDLNIRHVVANDGSMINTTPNLQSYGRWIENKVKRIRSQVFTTSTKGVKMENIDTLTRYELFVMIEYK